MTMLIPQVNEDRYPIDYYNILKAALILRAINHKLRHHIIHVIDESKSINVTDLYIKLRVEQSVISQHLAILRKAGIVKSSRLGKQIFYSLNEEKIALIERLSKELAA